MVCVEEGEGGCSGVCDRVRGENGVCGGEQGMG